MSALPKPALRGHLAKKGLSILWGAIAFSIAGGASYKFFVGMPREKAYNEAVRTYDPEKHHEELVKYGVLQSANIGGEK